MLPGPAGDDDSLEVADGLGVTSTCGDWKLVLACVEWEDIGVSGVRGDAPTMDRLA